MQDPAIASRLDGKTLRVIAVGKAAPFMADTFATIAGDRIRDGIVIGTHLPIALPAQLEWIPSSHPLPDERSVAAGRRALEVAQRTDPGDTLVVLLSGGASALMAVPAGNLTLEDKRTAVNALLKGGADITALNTIRKHLSAVKGGRLAAAAPGPTVCLAISDVVGDDLSVIGSGPTVPDPSTYRDAWNYIDRFGVEALLTQAAKDYLRAGLEGAIAETPKAGDPRFERSVTRVIGGRFNAMNGAAETARSLGYDVIAQRRAGCRRRADDGAGCPRAGADAGCRHEAARGRHRQRRNHRQGRRHGKGRPQSGDCVVGREGAWRTRPGDVALGSVGTDGIDGPTDAAGAYVDTTTIARAAAAVARRRRLSCRQQRLRVLPEARRSDHHRPSTTNVGDLQIVLFR